MNTPDSTPHKIALCITELDFGGAEQFLVELATRIDRRVFAPSVYCLGPKPVGAGESLVSRLEAANVPVRYFAARGIRGAWRVVRALRRALKRDRPALVQTFLWHANVIGSIAARNLVDEANHGRRVPIVTGLRVAEPRRHWRMRLERIAGRWADRHVAVSEGVAQLAREQIGLAARKIVVIPNGIDVDRFPASPIQLESLGVNRGRKILLFIGRLDHDDQKGAAGLLEHARSFLDRLADHDLLMIGDGPAAEKLRRRILALGLQDRVRWLGWRSDAAGILAAADVLLAPSRWEGMSNVVLEAMASGKPVLAFDGEGMAELLGRGITPPQPESKQLAAVENWPDLVEKIVAIAADPALGMELGMANQQRIAEVFRLDQVVAKYERLYESLVAASEAPPDTNS